MKKQEFYLLFQDIKNKLCMQDIDVDITRSETENEGCAERQFVYKTEWIDFREELLASTKEFIIDTIFHELLHYYLSFREPFIDSLDEDFGFTKKEVDIASNGIKDLEELVVTNLARSFTKLYIKLCEKK